MEIKILCPCGTKFKFDVEPIRGRMPSPVHCPACGAEATEQANSILRAALPPAVAPTDAPPAPPPPVPPPGPLRINRPDPPSTESSSVAPGSRSLPPPRAVPTRPVAVMTGSKPKNPVVKVLTTVLTLALVAFAAWRFGYKWVKRVNFVAKVASAVGQADTDSGDSEGAKNLWYEKCAVLFIQHTNHLDVAEACKEFWKVKLRKNLALIDSAQQYMNPGEYELISAHNGYVRIVGAHEWPEPEHEALAQFLSQHFGSLVFEWRSESFADTYHFGVYDHGARKFHAQMDVKIKQNDVEEIVTTEGNDFAIANGYQPGPQGFKEFNGLDADKITQRLGMKIWDEKEETDLKAMCLKETGPAAEAK